MTLIEAFKAANGRRIVRAHYLRYRGFDTTDGTKEAFVQLIDLLEPESIFADDWEVVKDAKKVVIENVTWEQIDEHITFPSTSSHFSWYTLIGKPKMKMTLEWEE